MAGDHSTRLASTHLRPDLAGLSRQEMLDRIVHLEWALDRLTKADHTWRRVHQALRLTPLEAQVMVVLYRGPRAGLTSQEVLERLGCFAAPGLARGVSARLMGTGHTVGTVQQVVYQLRRKVPNLVNRSAVGTNQRRPFIALTPHGVEQMSWITEAKEWPE